MAHMSDGKGPKVSRYFMLSRLKCRLTIFTSLLTECTPEETVEDLPEEVNQELE